ncbi:ubiquitin specific proteinase, putative, partial [Ixodes scapularis]
MSITRTKGLLNMPGQNNCFLNSAVQVLWHLDIFRRSFRELSGHICMAESCIFCALKELFAQFQYSQESALPPDALRRALAETFFDQRRFQLGFMDDAAECFENILQRIHFHIASQEVEDMCSVNHCIPHQKFAMTLVEQTVCHVCGASSEPLPFTQMVHYVSASALCLQASISHGKEQKPVSFGELLRRAGGMGDIRDCPSSCGAKIQICKTLMNSPDIVSLGLVWDSERPSVDHIIDVLDTIGMTINMNEMFHTVVDRWAASVTHHLVGIVTYYGKHYSTFFFHTKLCVWIYFDDATVREIGPHWQQVVDKCRRGHFQPLLLLYANPSGSPVCTANAPTTVIHYMTEHKRRSAHDTRHNGMGPQLHSAQNQYPKPRMRTYSDTSIMSEHPSEPSCSNSSDVEFKRPSDTLRRLVRRGSTEAALEAELNNTYISRQAVESVLNLQRLQRQRSLNGMRDKGSDCPDGACRRRDSGNWSGDRNSASSASSTSLDGSYYYIAGAKRACGSPGRTVNNFSKHEYMNVGVFADQGYDSYSLSSTDSYPSAILLFNHWTIGRHTLLVVGLKRKLTKKKTCGFHAGASGDCDKLCAQAELFLKKSYEKEQAGDLPLACFFCESAAAKARLAMDAPYSNTQSLVAAKMKHSTCIMRSSALCKRIKEAEMEERRRIKESSGHDVHHSRQGSRDSTHSRQSQKEGQHARQGSRDSSGGTIVECSDRPVKNIEIYATLPKKGSKKKSSALLSQMSVRLREDYPVNSRSKIRDGTSSLSKASTMRSKDSEFSDYSSEWEHARKPALHRTLSNPAGMKNRDEEDNANASGSSASAKKQHKIRRKLMGGFMRRKNRSLPDLRENKDAPQTESRALDDNVIFDSPGGVAPKPCHDDDADGREDHSATINSRGFHQPHRAFVNRALSQRPLLTKVDPPHVEVARSPSPIKFKHSPKVEHSDLYEPAGYAAALHQHSAVCTKRDKVAEQPRGSLSSNEFPPPPSPLPSQLDEEIETALEANCFLRELQIKRTQILSTVPKATESARKLSSEAYGQGAFHPEIDQASAENSWLRELQSKQMIPQAVQALQADHSRQAQLPPSDAVLRSVSPANSDSSKRPTRPPDYETALQRLEMMKERQRTASPDCLKLSAKSVPEGAHPQQPSQQQQQVPELNKKRKAALKKCVTFSDEVVLVACAEEEESDYLPNPLLERVYRQHAAKQDSKECQDL